MRKETIIEAIDFIANGRRECDPDDIGAINIAMDIILTPTETPDEQTKAAEHLVDLLCKTIHNKEDMAEARKGNDRDVHTEHCCKWHGCKYSDPDCPVANGKKTQSFECEECGMEQIKSLYYIGNALI